MHQFHTLRPSKRNPIHRHHRRALRTQPAERRNHFHIARLLYPVHILRLRNISSVDRHVQFRSKVQDTRTGNYLSNESLEQLPHLPYRSIIPYDERTLLLGVDGTGVYATTRDAKSSWSFLNANQEEEGELKGNGIYALCKDSSSNLWIEAIQVVSPVPTPKNISSNSPDTNTKPAIADEQPRQRNPRRRRRRPMVRHQSRHQRALD